MRVLILGGGGREHALYHRIVQSPLAEKVFVWPGNGLIPAEDRVDKPAITTDFTDLVGFLREHSIDCTVVGNETPLVHGVRDFIKSHMPAHWVFGPDKYAAQLEGSKAFAVEFLRAEKIPHGESVLATSLEEALKTLPKQELPLVIKADGLAAGKGVSIHHDFSSAQKQLERIFNEKIFGDAGKRVLLQRFLKGHEASLFALCNGTVALLLPVARDYKRALDGDAGDNTGGMGAYAPAGHLSEAHKAFIADKIIAPLLRHFQYRGLLYIGLMVGSERADDVAVVEFNCRFGDPETQSVLPLLEGDVLEYLLWCDGYPVQFPILEQNGVRYVPYRRGAVVNVVIAARGYPADFARGIPLFFPETNSKDTHIIGAGIEERDGRYFSTAGRIANVVAYGKSIEKARELVYGYLRRFQEANANCADQLYWRSDIAQNL
ncbi:MAG: phosphoribosylamine--glycine ligase [Turneriella sp.]|nr:phosphoribosylamine--glycine ligase [Turneriella sp.]